MKLCKFLHWFHRRFLLSHPRGGISSKLLTSCGLSEGWFDCCMQPLLWTVGDRLLLHSRRALWVRLPPGFWMWWCKYLPNVALISHTLQHRGEWRGGPTYSSTCNIAGKDWIKVFFWFASDFEGGGTFLSSLIANGKVGMKYWFYSCAFVGRIAGGMFLLCCVVYSYTLSIFLDKVVYIHKKCIGSIVPFTDNVNIVSQTFQILVIKFILLLHWWQYLLAKYSNNHYFANWSFLLIGLL